MAAQFDENIVKIVMGIGYSDYKTESFHNKARYFLDFFHGKSWK